LKLFVFVAIDMSVFYEKFVVSTLVSYFTSVLKLYFFAAMDKLVFHGKFVVPTLLCNLQSLFQTASIILILTYLFYFCCYG
jgi:hypothetical protein